MLFTVYYYPYLLINIIIIIITKSKTNKNWWDDSSGASVLKGLAAQDAAVRHKIDQLEKALERLSLIYSHDALVLLKNSLSMPKLLYTLRTADCSDNTLLAIFDNVLRSDLSSILNVDLSDIHWLQASLPVRHRRLGIRSAQMLAPSAFLASAASTYDLPQSILPESIGSLDDESVSAVEIRWTSLSNSQKPAAELLHIQRAIQHPHFLPTGHRNSWYLALPGGGTDTRDRKTDGQHHRWREGDHLPVPAAVYCTTEWKYGLIPTHVHYIR